MGNEIKVTTGALMNHAKSISDLALFVGDVSTKNSSAINKMEDACSFLRVGGIYASANYLINQFTSLLNALNQGAAKAMGCANAYQEANDSLINEYKDWFEGVEAGEANCQVMTLSTGNPPVDLDAYLEKVPDAEYALLSKIWNDVCNSDDPLNEFLKRLSELPEHDPLRKITADQIMINKSYNGLSVITLTDNNSGNAIVIFSGTNDSDVGDYLNDFLIAKGKMSPQEIDAINLVNNLSQSYSNITVTGYSLGGYLASAATLRCPSVAKCVTFNPPGRYDYLIQKYGNGDAWSKVKTYEAGGDTVSSVGAAVGNLVKLNVDDNWIGPIHNHKIEAIYEALGGESALLNTWEPGYTDLVTDHVIA